MEYRRATAVCQAKSISIPVNPTNKYFSKLMLEFRSDVIRYQSERL